MQKKLEEDVWLSIIASLLLSLIYFLLGYFYCCQDVSRSVGIDQIKCVLDSKMSDNELRLSNNMVKVVA